ncbi:MAG: apolipoprotein N-acyltransferase [Nocardioides sp.]|nr:apolipoprotein N-acyltransferase [Nocardioides sp.]
MPLRLLLTLLSGIGLGLAFEPLGFVILMPVAIAVLLWCVRGRSIRGGAIMGACFGIGNMAALLFWLRVIGTDAWLALSLFEALYFALAGAGLAAVSRLRLWPLWSACVWVGVETFRGDWPMSGLTWGRLAFASIDTPFERWLPWVGANGVSLLIVLTSGCVLWGLLELPQRRMLAAATLALTAGTVILPWLIPVHAQSDGKRTVAVVQGNVPGSGEDLIAYHREVTASHMSATRELAAEVAAGREPEPDFVLWPENSTAVDPFRDAAVHESLVATSAAIGVPILVGAIVDPADDTKVLNQGIVYDPETGAGDRYTKRHPVPFGEYIPYRDFFGKFSFGRLEQIPRDMLSGTRREPLRIADTEIADVICFDISYDDTIIDQVTRGGRLLVVQTSNAMFIHTGQIEQQFAISRVRALETGRTVAVAAVNGRSGVIGPDGDVISAIEPRTRNTLVQKVELSSEITLAMRIGPWVGRLSVLLGLAACAWAILSYRLQSQRWEKQGEES